LSGNAMRPDPIIFIGLDTGTDGGFRLTLSQTKTSSAMGQFRGRGWLQADPYVIHVPRSPNDGKDATPQQIATAVAAYLTANPPAPGRAPTSAEILAAVTTYMAANPGLSKTEYLLTLPDAYVLGLLPGADTKRLACAGLRTTDTLTIQPTAITPAGYGGWTIGCTESGWARVGFIRPQLAVGANNSVALKVTAFR